MKLRSSTTTRRQRPASPDRLPPVHPGEVLLEEFLKPMSITQYRLAKDISVPPRRVNEIVLHKRGITADTALRLGRYFGTSEQFWLNLQSEYDLDVERDRLGDRLIEEVVKPRVGTVGVSASPDGPWTRKSTGSLSRWQVASSKRTGSKAATAASRALRSGSTSKKSKSAAGSALAQRKSAKVTSGKAASAASATLRSGSTGKASKSAAASALAQRQRRRK
jgi:addiction module HigA family antidote